MEKGKMIYVASPYAGDVEANVQFARDACRHCIEQGHVPIAVHLLYPEQILDDNDPAQREIGLQLGLRVLDRCDQLWVFGERISPGMAGEIEHARASGIPVLTVGSQEMYGTMQVIDQAEAQSLCL